MSDTTITVVGNLTREFELRFTNGGKAVASTGLAVNRKINDVETVSFYNLTVWDTLAENASKLAKGTRVVATGRIEVRPYKANDGADRISVDITADALGPDLRWATADVTKSAPGGGTQTQAANAQRQAPLYGDEEPF